MQDPQETPVEETVETPTPEGGEEPETPKTPTEVPETPEQPQEEAPPVEIPEQKKYRLKVQGKEVEVDDEQELIALAQKGWDYDQRIQSLSSLEKAQAEKLQLAERFMSNPGAVKYAVAEQLGYDPEMVLGNVPAPDPSWREMYPEQFGRQQEKYELAQRQKQQFETALQGMIAFNAQSANNAAFEKARLEHNLTDEQYQQVQSFVQNRMRPNQAGFYSTEDVGYAVNALYGKERLASEKLKQAATIQKTIKQATTPRATPKGKPEEVSPELKAAREYLEWTQGVQGGWTQKE